MFRVFECAACERLAESTRTHTITCSPRCRTWLHRHPERLRFLKALCVVPKVPLALVLEVAAVKRLRPDLGVRIASGDAEIEDVRREVWGTWMARVLAAADEARHE